MGLMLSFKKILKMMGFPIILLVFSNPVWAHDITPSSLVFDKTVNINNPATLTFEVKDETGCNADITATVEDTSVVTVSPAEQEGVETLFTVTKVARGPASTSIRVIFKGKGTNPMGGACLDDAFGDVDVEIKPGILEITPKTATVFVAKDGEMFGKGNDIEYSATNTGDDAIFMDSDGSQSWVSVEDPTGGFFNGFLDPGETASDKAIISLFLPNPLGTGLFEGTANFKNETNGLGDTSIPVFFLVGEKEEVVALLPNQFFSCNRNGKCDPENPTLTLGNPEDTTLEVTVTSDQDWIDLAVSSFPTDENSQPNPESGNGFALPKAQSADVTLEPGRVVIIDFTANSNINNLPNGNHQATITFTNIITNEVLATRKLTATLTDDPLPKSQNESKVIAPFWQTDSGTYTFMSIAHPSLERMNSRIGVSISAVKNSGVSLALPKEFTISSGESRKIFIVATNNININPTNLPDDELIIGNEETGHGMVVINPVASDPKEMSGSGEGAGFQDVTMLSLWGAVVIQGNSTGFAMEFVGDLKDSRSVNSGNFSGVN